MVAGGWLQSVKGEKSHHQLRNEAEERVIGVMSRRHETVFQEEWESKRTGGGCAQEVTFYV